MSAAAISIGSHATIQSTISLQIAVVSEPHKSRSRASSAAGHSDRPRAANFMHEQDSGIS
jgi:hypothetical protein